MRRGEVDHADAVFDVNVINMQIGTVYDRTGIKAALLSRRRTRDQRIKRKPGGKLIPGHRPGYRDHRS